ncbi:MAG: hypothetical protein HPY45_15515 [Anaerolineae bacterium]|nr:hypothetical protein [Anaerolineae bacterium]
MNPKTTPNHPQDACPPEVAKYLEALRAVPPRNPQLAQQTRQQFLAQVQSLQTPVSRSGNLRPIQQKGFLSRTSFLLFRKERFAMTLITTLLTLIALLGGITGGTVYAAQSSLPQSPLYPVKLASEALVLQLTSDPIQRLDLLEQLSARRMEEINTMLQQGEQPPEATLERLQTHTRAALQTAASLDDAQLQPALATLELRLQDRLRQMDQIRTCLETPDAACPQLHQNLPPSPQAVQRMEQAQNVFRAQLQLVQDGQQNTERFRHQVQNGILPTPADTQPPTDTTPLPETPPAEPTAGGVTPEASAEPEINASASQQPQPALQNTPNAQAPQGAPTGIAPGGPHHTPTAQPPHGSNLITPQAAQQQQQQQQQDQQQDQQNAPQANPGGNGNGNGKK